MDNWVITMMLSASLFLGAIALVAFMWGVKNGQFDDEEKFLNAVKFDNEDDLNSAMEAEKKKKEARKNQKVIVTKEIKLSVKIAQNDIDYKVKHAREFIEKGYHVKFRVFLRGREMANPAAGAEVLTRVWPMVEDIASKENNPKLEGRYVNMLVTPIKKEKN